MSGKNIIEIEANKDIDGTEVFEGTFAKTHIDELMLEFTPKHVGVPVATLKGDGGASKEIHMIPLRGREGRFAVKLAGPEAWNGIRVHMVRETKGHLVKVKLIGKPPA